MRVIELKPRFSQETGEPCGTVERTKHHRCDYCGKVLSCSLGLAVRLDYGDCIDTCFGSNGDEFAFVEEHGVDMFGLLGAPYCFCNHWNGDGAGQPLCEQALALEFLACTFSDMPEPRPPEGMAPMRDAHDLQAAFRAARVRAAAKLVADGEVTPRELGEEER